MNIEKITDEVKDINNSDVITMENKDYILVCLRNIEYHANNIKSHVFLRFEPKAKEIIDVVNSTLDKITSIRNELDKDEPDLEYVGKELDIIHEDRLSVRQLSNDFYGM